jgi:hypothetical protein
LSVYTLYSMTLRLYVYVLYLIEKETLDDWWIYLRIVAFAAWARILSRGNTIFSAEN